MFSLEYNPKNGNLSQVKYYRSLDLNVMPLRLDGTKAPIVRFGELGYQTSTIPAHYTYGYFRKPSGIGVICGCTSGGLEVWDFDQAGLFYRAWRAIVDEYLPNLLDAAPVIETPSGGKHLLVRSDHYGRSMKLAFADYERKFIGIETRGQGGQAVLPGSPLETHKTGKPYRLISGSFASIPVITAEQRERLISVSVGFDEGKPIEPREPRQIIGSADAGAVGDRPGDDFNVRGDWADILEPMGWTLTADRGGVCYWRRPGKDGPGDSATTGYCGENLHVFSSSAAPFEGEGTYSKFAAFAMLWCDGDYSFAARHLAELGFGQTEDITEKAINIIERSK